MAYKQIKYPAQMNNNLSKKRIDYFDHEADIGIIGRGHSVEQAFISAAEAMFAIMTDLQQIQTSQKVNIEFDETDLDFALVTWLNLLISTAREQNLIFCSFFLEKNNSHWHGTATGEAWRDDIVRGTEVKGATLTMLSVKKNQDVWEAACVVDV